MIIDDTHNILFTGDSITDARRSRPVGEDMKESLGQGFVANIASILEAWRPGHQHRIRNTGISGNTVHDLQQRWESDVLALKPDWLSIMIGVNDCARAFNRPLITEELVPLEAYRDTLTELIAQSKNQVSGIILMSPFYVDSSFGDPLRLALNSYINAMQDIAKEHSCVFINSQAVIDNFLHQAYAGRISGDSVHPNRTGHMLLAKAWLDAVGFTWN